MTKVNPRSDRNSEKVFVVYGPRRGALGAFDAGNLEPLVVACQGSLILKVEIVLEGLLLRDAAQVAFDQNRFLLLFRKGSLAKQTPPNAVDWSVAAAVVVVVVMVVVIVVTTTAFILRTVRAHNAVVFPLYLGEERFV